MYDIAQTFMLDKRGVLGADTAFVTSVELYFKGKPVEGKTISGIPRPGVEVYITSVNNELPLLTGVAKSRARVEFENITSSVDASVATKFTFNAPIPLKTDRQYGVLIKFDGGDTAFDLWKCTSGENELGSWSRIATTDSAKIDGSFFQLTNGILTPQKNVDLKIKVNVAKFTSTAADFRVVNKAYEFLSLDETSITGVFREGEYCYQDAAYGTGNVATVSTSTTLTGDGTTFLSTFAVGEKFVITDQTVGNTDIRTITAIANNTSLTLDEVPSFSNATGRYIKTPVARVRVFDIINDDMILNDSTAANSTHRFVAAGVVKGADTGAQATISTVDAVESDRFLFSAGYVAPEGTRITGKISIANSTYGANSSIFETIEFGRKLAFDEYQSLVQSRSIEVTQPTLFANTKSVQATLTFETLNPYTSPYLDDQSVNLFVYKHIINNDTTGEWGSYGNAASKHITKRITLADGQDAEDLRVFLTAYRPANTTVKVYAKLLNVGDFEPFDTKQWTELELADAQTQEGASDSITGLFSNPTNKSDNVILEYRIPFKQSANTLSGSVATTLSSATVTGSNTAFNTELVEGDLVRITSTEFPDNHMHAVVNSVSGATSLTLKSPVANASLVGTGFKIAKVDHSGQAFINNQGNNIVRYYTTEMAEMDTFKSVQVKVVLLSETSYRTPIIKDLRVLAVTA
jgi:hypothetical protein